MSPAEWVGKSSGGMEKGGIFPQHSLHPTTTERQPLAFGGREGVYNIVARRRKGGYCVSEGRVAEKSIYFP